MGTSSFALISLRRVSEESQSPRRWKQCSHVARDMRDSERPDQPKRAKVKATLSVADVGGGIDADVNKLLGRRWRISFIDGSGYMMFSRSGRSAATAWKDWYRARRLAVLGARLAMGMWYMSSARYVSNVLNEYVR